MTTEIRAHEYVVLNQSSEPPQEVARLWWDGAQVQCNPRSYLTAIADLPIVGHFEKVNGERVLVMPDSVESGIAFLEALPARFRNGYTTCHRVR